MFQRSAVAQIRREAQGLASATFDLGRCFLNEFLAACGGDDIGSGICEAETYGAPYPGSASDHNGSLAFKTEDRARHCFSDRVALRPRKTGAMCRP